MLDQCVFAPGPESPNWVEESGQSLRLNFAYKPDCEESRIQSPGKNQLLMTIVYYFVFVAILLYPVHKELKKNE